MCEHGSSGVDGVRRIDPLVSEEWDRGVGVFRDRSVFHTGAWARVLRDTYGFSPIYFVLVRNGSWVGALPVMEVRSWVRGCRGVSLPFSDRCEALGVESGDEALLVEEALRCGRGRGWRSVEFRGLGSVGVQGQPAVSFYSHVLDISAGEGSLFGGFSKSARWGIGKAARCGVKLQFTTSLEGLKEYYRLHCLTRRRLGMPPQPFSFFLNIHTHVVSQGMGQVVLASYQGVSIAGAVFLHTGESVTYKFGASERAFQHLQPNNLILWEAIKRYAGEGFRMFDFGRTSLFNEGLRRFKLGFGTSEVVFSHYKYDLRRSRFVGEVDRSRSGLNRFFQLLPMSLLRIVGSVLYRHSA